MRAQRRKGAKKNPSALHPGGDADFIFRFQNPEGQRLAAGVLRRMPVLAGRRIRIERAAGLRDRGQALHAGAFLRERRIAFDCTPREFPRIFVHEVFHFVWARAGNWRRWSFEGLLESELRAGASGELGWSAEWRKRELTAENARLRGRRWREYCCESFCDTAAWLYSGVERHVEFTLGTEWRRRREAWFRRSLGGGPLPV